MKLPVALLAAAALTLTACSAGGGAVTPSPTVSSSTAPGAPDVDRDPSGELPTISFDADGIPTMTTVDADPPSVISVQTLTAGDGETVADGDFVTVDYAGFLWSDGSEFDGSYGTGAPAHFSLHEVVDGWRYGLTGTRVGDRVLVVVPPDYGYGDVDDDSIPAGSTLVFVVDVLATVTVTTEALTAATPVEATLPPGLTVSGELGQEPALEFAADSPEPTEAQVIVLAEGSGDVVTDTDYLLYHVVLGYWGSQDYSSWSESFQQTEGGGGPETIGQRVGSRLLLIYPTDDENGIESQAIVIDLLAAIPEQ